MDVRTLLRASLIPLGAALVTRGLQNLRDEADQLADEVTHRRRQLAGEEPLDDDDQADDEEAAAPSPQEIFRARGAAGGISTARFPVRGAALGLLGLVVGVAAGRAVAAAAHRAQLADAVAAARSSLLVDQPPPPGSPADLAARARLADEDDDQADEDDDLADEDDDLPAPLCRGDCPACRSVSAVGAVSDPFQCDRCDYVTPAGQPESRRLWLTLHRNGHAAGLGR